MSAKTPVSLLQEMSAKLKIAPPQYDLIYSRSEGVNPEFKYQVTFKDLSAVGAGRSKKEAKHNAAVAYTKLTESSGEMLQDASKVMSLDDPVASPYCNQVNRNYVGELATLCADKLPDPLYQEVSAEGPSHAPFFTISCKVLNFLEKAQSTTKKQAKHLVAKKMLARLEGCLKTLIPEPKILEECNIPAGTEEENIFSRLQAMPHIPITHVSNSKKKNLHLLYETPKLLKSVPVDRDTATWDPVQRIKDLAGEMNVSYGFKVTAKTDLEFVDKTQNVDDAMPSSSNSNNKTQVLWFAQLTLETNPHIVQLAEGGSAAGAERAVAEKTLDHLSIMIEGIASKRQKTAV